MKLLFGTFDGWEVCKLMQSYTNKIVLYSDDGLASSKKIIDPKPEKVKNNFQKLFKENELDTVIQCNMKVVNYLDFTLKLENSVYRLKKLSKIRYYLQ